MNYNTNYIREALDAGISLEDLVRAYTKEVEAEQEKIKAEKAKEKNDKERAVAKANLLDAVKRCLKAYGMEIPDNELEESFNKIMVELEVAMEFKEMMLKLAGE